MPILHNAKKALRVSKRKAEMNQPVRSKVKTMIDQVKKEATIQTVAQAFSAIDRAVKRHVIHRKKAARLKSQVSKKLKAADAPAAPKAPAKAAKPAPKAKAAAKKTK